MADVIISQLTRGTPTGNHLLPYSTGVSTQATPVNTSYTLYGQTCFYGYLLG